MPKFLARVQYTAHGFEGMIKEGFAAREAHLRADAERHGVRVEALYWAYGEDDLIAVLDARDSTTVIAYAMAVGIAGVGRQTTTPLLTAAEMDAAARQMPEYRAPGR